MRAPAKEESDEVDDLSAERSLGRSEKECRTSNERETPRPSAREAYMMIERARNAASLGARRCRTWPSASERTRSLHMLRTHVPTAAHAGSSGRVSGVSATPVGAASDDDGSTSWYPAGRLTNNRLREPSGMFSAAWMGGLDCP